jgi:hypothetical protein
MNRNFDGLLDPGSGPVLIVRPPLEQAASALHPLVDQVPADFIRGRRHVAGCSYLPVDQVWRKATPDEMRDVPACTDCVSKVRG